MSYGFCESIIALGYSVVNTLCHEEITNSYSKASGSVLPWLTGSYKCTVAQSRQPLRCRFTRCNPRDVVAKRLHESDSLVVVRILEADLIRFELVMESVRVSGMPSGIPRRCTYLGAARD